MPTIDPSTASQNRFKILTNIVRCMSKTERQIKQKGTHTHLLLLRLSSNKVWKLQTTSGCKSCITAAPRYKMQSLQQDVPRNH